jgi:hypothetical protein
VVGGGGGGRGALCAWPIGDERHVHVPIPSSVPRLMRFTATCLCIVNTQRKGERCESDKLREASTLSPGPFREDPLSRGYCDTGGHDASASIGSRHGVRLHGTSTSFATDDC